MLLHSNATTTYATRRKISAATGSVRSIAAQLGVSVSAVRRWRHRESVEDRSSRPQTIACSIVDDNSERLLELRRKGMSLDDIFEIVMDEMPKLSRSALYRFFKRHGLGKLASPKREPHKCFKEYEPGYLHIDCFYMPRFAGKRSYCFVAVDRATRRTHVAWYSSRSQKVGADFLQQCIDEFEFKIVIVLTDNGTEFTNKSYKAGKAKRIHAFDALCAAPGIKHRLTKPRTPKTNGLVERHNQIIKNATVNANTYVNVEAAFDGILAWNKKNNQKRKRRLHYKTPFQKSEEWYKIKPELFHREPILKAA